MHPQAILRFSFDIFRSSISLMAVTFARVGFFLIIVLFFFFFPKQWYTEGFWRLGKDIHECFGRSPAPVARQLLCTGCGLGEGQVALVHAKRSLAPLSTEKHMFWHNFLQILFWASFGPDASQMPPKCLPDASQMPLRCLSDASRCFPQKTVWGLALG